MKLPTYWQKLRSLPEDPPGLIVYGFVSDMCQGTLMIQPITHEELMPFSKEQIIAQMRPALKSTGTALVEADSGKAANGEPYVYTIVKIPNEPAHTGVEYNLTFHRVCDGQPMQYRAGLKEQGVTGMRDALVLELSFRDGTVTSTEDGLQGWFRDPYDPSITGFTANLSDLAKYDALFPGHALTNARELLVALEE